MSDGTPWIAEWRRVRPADDAGGGLDLRIGPARTLMVGDLVAARFAFAAMAGHVDPRGQILIDGHDVGGRPAHKRRVVVIGRDLGLPRGRVARVVGGTARGGPALETALEAAGLTAEADWPIERLDQGGQLRLAIARAAATHPRLLAIDLALDALDPAMASDVLDALARVQREFGTAVVIATARPAALIGQPIGVRECVAAIVRGRVLQAGPPQLLYDEPADADIVDLVGPTNWLAARVIECDEDGAVRCGLDDGAEVEATATGHPPVAGAACRIDIRPERIAIAIGSELAEQGGLVAQVEALSFDGASATVAIRLRAGSRPMTVRRPVGGGTGRLVPGTEISIAWQTHHARVWLLGRLPDARLDGDRI